MSSREDTANTFLYTSESVGEGHPDKVCDQVSDAILDAHLRQDMFSHVSCQTAAKTGMILVCGDIISKAHVNFQRVIRQTIKQIGYDKSAKGHGKREIVQSLCSLRHEAARTFTMVNGVREMAAKKSWFDYKTCNVIQSLDLHNPEDEDNGYEGQENEEKPARDLGLMFGYATDETEECMPLTITLSHNLNAKIAELRRSGQLAWARPDTKTQVTVEYRSERGAMVPVRVHTVVISAQHDETVTLEQLRSDLMEQVVRPVIPPQYLDEDTIFHIQPSGRFIIGGPQGDAGLTGRKIIVDTYGGWGAHGGGALSGKDPAQIDRCASYAARWVAKSLVKAGLCRRVLVQLAYSMGVVEPLSVMVYSYGTSNRSQEELLSIVNKNFDLRPGKIVSELNLRRPIYQKTACYGHFGRPEFPWEMPKTLQM